MTPTVIFDLYDTLVRVDSMDFSKGLELVYESFLSGLCTPEELKKYNAVSLEKYIALHAEEKEYPFLKEELPDYFAHFGANVPPPGEDFEYAFLKQSGSYSLCDHAEETLEKLKDRGARLFVLSNSIYTSASALRLLEELGIAGYFDRVFSSADVGVCKPSPAFFAYAGNEIRRTMPDFDPAQAVFCGDRYDLDAAGGVRAGMRTVWINKKNAPNPDALPVTEIRDLCELPGLLFP